MRLTIGAYWPFLLLFLVPGIWWIQRKSQADLSPKHLALLSTVRSLVIVLLALALAQPVVYRTGVWLSVVYLLDVSQSVAPSAIQSSIQWIEEANAGGQPDHSMFIPFGENSAIFDQLDQLKTVQVASRANEGGIDQSGTDIESAIDRGLRSLAPHHLKRMVLMTDGNENSGHMMNTISRLKQEGVHVYTVPIPTRTNRDVWVESIMAPAQVNDDELFPLEAHVYSQVETPADVEVKYREKSLGKRKVQLKKGLNRIGFEGRIKDETGPVTLVAEVTSSGDPFPDNNRFRDSLVVQGRPRILYVEGRAESARYLQQALNMEGLTAVSVPPERIPNRIEDLDSFDAIVLSDVSRKNLTEEQMSTIATYVRDLGGGFIVSGGENHYGEGGYAKTVLEEVLPVTFETKKPKPDSIAMIIVLDKSGSMAGPKMELAKEATKAPLAKLKDEDRFGVVAFDYNFYWPVRFQPVANRGAIEQAISTIIAGGETNIFPALKEAYKQLIDAATEIKHVILLSDGRSLPEDFEGLTRLMSEQKITVSTVAVGEGADRDLLAKIAVWGKGRSYYIRDADRVPQIFAQETDLATGKTLREEEEFKPAVKKNVEAFKGINFADAPPLLGYVAVTPKDTSEVLLQKDDDPILARWQYGLGKTAAFTSDLKDRWAAQWLTWSGYPKFWSQLVREIMRRRDDNDFDFRVAREGREAKITINAIQRDGQFKNKLQSQVRIISPNQSVSTVNVFQVGPGSYEATFPLTERGSYLFRAIDQRNGGPSRILEYSYPEEYHFYPPNTDILHEISQETGGIFQPDSKAIFDANGETTALPTPLWPYVAILALALYISDVYLRRLRLFE